MINKQFEGDYQALPNSGEEPVAIVYEATYAAYIPRRARRRQFCSSCCCCLLLLGVLLTFFLMPRQPRIM